MRVVIGVLMMVAGVVLGLYAGIWWAFIGGITGAITGVMTVPVDGAMIAVGVAKVFFAGLIGWGSGVALFLPGLALAGSGTLKVTEVRNGRYK